MPVYLLLRSDSLPGACCECTAKERGCDEYPDILEGLSACEKCGADGTCRVHGSSGEVDAHQMDEDKAEADCKTCEVACANLGVGGTKNHEDEEEGGNHFNEACSPYAAGICNAVGAECAGEIRSSNSLGNKQKDSAGEDTADNLTAPISACILPAHASAEGDAEGDSRIDMAATDSADGVCHCNNGKTESDCSTYNTCRCSTAKEHCGSAAEEGKNECSYAFSDVLFHNLISLSSVRQI